MTAWLRRIGLALAAILIAVGFSMLGRPKRRQRAAEDSRDQLIAEGGARARAKARKAGAAADRLQADAKEAAAVGQAAIDKVGADHEDMRALLDSFRADPGGV